jgi:hypothetical protein
MSRRLLAIAVGAGLQVMGADVDALCGPKGRHDPDRTATRHGSEVGAVTLGGRRVPVRRPSVRAVEGSGELPVLSYEAFTSTELLGRKAMEQIVGLRERGLDVTRPVLTVLDGSKALARAVKDVLDHPVIARCQLHFDDVRIMPRWSLIPLRGRGFGLARAA